MRQFSIAFFLALDSIRIRTTARLELVTTGQSFNHRDGTSLATVFAFVAKRFAYVSACWQGFATFLATLEGGWIGITGYAGLKVATAKFYIDRQSARITDLKAELEIK